MSLLFLPLCYLAFSTPLPLPLPRLLGVLFNPKLPLLSWSVPSDVQFSPQSLWLTWSMSVSWDARLLRHVMSIYFLKITPSTPHSSDYEPNSTYIFLCFWWWWWWWWLHVFFQFSSALRTIIVGFHFNGFSFCVLHVVLKHFRVTLPSSPAEILWALLSSSSSFPVKVAVIENRHGTTHCLNTVDHRKRSREDAPSR